MYKLLLPFLVLGLVACSPSKKSSSNSDDSNTLERAGEQHAPGTAKVRFSVEKIVNDENQTIWEIHVHEVLGYGSATPLINADSKLSVDATIFIKYSDYKSSYFKAKDELIGLLESMGEQAGDSNKSTSWKLASISDKK